MVFSLDNFSFLKLPITHSLWAEALSMLVLHHPSLFIGFSQEIIAYIMSKVKSHGGHKRRFSLYLSAQLMYGTVKVFYQQNVYLLSAYRYIY